MNMNTKIDGFHLKSRINTIKSSWNRKSFKIAGIIFITFLILKNPFIACTNTNSPFYNQVLNDFDSTSYFIALKIKSQYYKGPAIIQNNNLYKYLHKTKGLDKGKYILYMKRILWHHRALKTTDMDILTWKFIKVSEVESVVINANQGRDKFVANYFDGIILNYGITEEEQNAIITQLFYWEIPARFDKLTGDLIIG